MKKVIVLFLVVFSFKAISEESGLQHFSMSFEEIQSEGSIVYYSDSVSNIESGSYLLVEGWEYISESKAYKYHCYVKVGNKIYTINSISHIQKEGKLKAVYKNDSMTLIIETEYLKPIGYESYQTKGTITLIMGNTDKIIDVIGGVAV
ncbi:MAG: hypothetical protein OEY96_10065 [Gammaproteobacteria bacterium]|nr:hypothetical protein [Gammaproteobacteria bacterium]